MAISASTSSLLADAHLPLVGVGVGGGGGVLRQAGGVAQRDSTARDRQHVSVWRVTADWHRSAASMCPPWEEGGVLPAPCQITLLAPPPTPPPHTHPYPPVDGWQLFGLSLSLHCLQLLVAAEAGVGTPLSHQPVNVLLVDGRTLRLAVRLSSTTHIRTCGRRGVGVGRTHSRRLQSVNHTEPHCSC